MIYRIKLVKDGKFVRYATDEEMESLRPKADGSGVERMILLSAAGIYNGWCDISATHKVEWGIMTSDKHCNRIPIYDGDIYIDWNTGLENEHTKPSVFHIWNMEHALDEMFPMIEVIGNINENPELLA